MVSLLLLLLFNTTRSTSGPHKHERASIESAAAAVQHNARYSPDPLAQVYEYNVYRVLLGCDQYA